LRVVDKKVQNDNLLNLNANSINNVKNFSSTIDCTSTQLPSTSALTPSPKIKVSRIKFNNQQQQQQQQQQAQQTPSLSSSASSDSEPSVATIQQQLPSCDSISPNRMQAESGSIAELQKYQNKYLKNRRHTLAANTAINLRWAIFLYSS
jgi:hypothetical protein